MPMSIGTMRLPSCARSAGVFTSSPTIPHMSCSPVREAVDPKGRSLAPGSEELEVARDLPVGDVAHVLDPLHALQADELLGDGAERLHEQRVALERVERLAEVL